MERRRPPGPVADRDEVRAIGLGDGQQRLAVEDADAGRLVRQARQPLELGHRDAAQVERPFGALGQADDDEAEPVLAGLIVLLDQAALLERRQQPRGRRLVEARAAGRARSRRLRPASRRARVGAPPLDRPSGPRCRRGPSSVLVSRLSRPPVTPCRRAGCGSAPPWARSRAPHRASRRTRSATRSMMSASACASHMNHGSRRVRLRHRASGVHADRDRVVQLVVACWPSRGTRSGPPRGT